MAHTINNSITCYDSYTCLYKIYTHIVLVDMIINLSVYQAAPEEKTSENSGTGHLPHRHTWTEILHMHTVTSHCGRRETRKTCYSPGRDTWGMSLLTVAMIKTPWIKATWRERVYWLPLPSNSPSWRELRAVTQRQRLKWRPWRYTVYWLTVRCVLTHQLLIRKKPSQTFL